MAILHSHRNCIAYYEHAKIMKIDDKVAYTKTVSSKEYSFAIPYGNVASILLGPGVSITTAALQQLASEGVLVAITGGEGVPIFMGSLSEYRSTEYCQLWLTKWQNKDWQLKTAKNFQIKRSELVLENWNILYKNQVNNVLIDAQIKLKNGLSIAETKEQILGYEANYAKTLYAILSKNYGLKFSRVPEEKSDLVNALIDTHNYYAYSVAATVLWTLGIPYAFPVLHGETRRGALVFDLADIIKDAYLLPLAFEAKANNIDKEQYKKICIESLNVKKVMPLLFNEIKKAIDD